MRNKLLLLAVLAITLTACEKNPDVVTVPVAEDARWILFIEGAPTDSFHFVYRSSVPPFQEVHYYDVMSNGNNKQVIKMIVGKTYSIEYMDRDSVISTISHTPVNVDPIFNTIPATMW